MQRTKIVKNPLLHATWLLAASLLTASGCASTGGSTAVSQNHDSRVRIIVIHHTTADYEEAYEILTVPSDRSVSSHYLIPEPDDPSYDRKKLETQLLVPESRRAWHAGTSYWSGKSGLNDQSIGIELVNQAYCHQSENGTDNSARVKRICFYPDFADQQIALLVMLLKEIQERHPDVIPRNIVGHSDIAPDRKVDPGPRFPWQRLYKLGYGAWYDDDTVIRYWEQFNANPMPLLNIQKALHAYGYAIDITGLYDEQTRNVLRAFQLHFRPSQVTSKVTTESAAVLFALIEKYLPDELEQLLMVEESEGADLSQR